MIRNMLARNFCSGFFLVHVHHNFKSSFMQDVLEIVISEIFRRSELLIMNEIMTEKQAARYLNRSTKTLQRRRRDGQISFIRDGRIYYRRSDLDAYLAARRTEATKAPPPAPAPKYKPLSGRAKAHQDALLDII